MTKIHRTADGFKVEVQGWSVVWALKKCITFRKDQIISVEPNEMRTDLLAWRMPGTALPRVILAGSYQGKRNGVFRREFWDFYFKPDCVRIELRDHHYNRLVIQVRDVQEAIELLK